MLIGQRSNLINQSSSQRIESLKLDWRSDKIYGITADPLIIPPIFLLSYGLWFRFWIPHSFYPLRTLALLSFSICSLVHNVRANERNSARRLTDKERRGEERREESREGKEKKKREEKKRKGLASRP